MDNLIDVMSIIGSILLIVGVLILTYYTSRWYARRMGAAGSVGKYIRIVDRASVGRAAMLAIAEVNGRYYLLGITEKGIDMLSEVEDPTAYAASNPPPDVPQQSFSAIFGDLMGKAGIKKKQDDGGAQ